MYHRYKSILVDIEPFHTIAKEQDKRMGNHMALQNSLKAGVLRDEAPLSLLEVDDFPDSFEILNTDFVSI